MISDPDYWRQLGILSPDHYNTPITVIGAGATGSYIAFELAKMGCNNITVYDHDIVEDHNLPNQMYGVNDCDKKKVDVLKELIKRETNIDIKVFPEKFTEGELKGVVFVLTDSMKSRKEIWENSLKLKLGVELVVETRMGAESGRIYAVEPASPRQVEAYEKTLYSDEDSEQSACTATAIAPTVSTIAGMAIWAMIHKLRGTPFYNEQILSLSPSHLIARNFK